MLALVRTALANFGMECYTAVDGPSALEMIRRYRPHAAVLDVNMPGMDGYEVLSAIRSEEIPVRILLLTARQQESDVIRGFTLGADDYVVKPFSPHGVGCAHEAPPLAMIRIELSVVACLVGLYTLFLVAMYAVLSSRASRRRRQGVGAKTFTPQIRDALVDFLSGSNEQTKIREYAKSHRAELIDSLSNFMAPLAVAPATGFATWPSN
ncbi:MAG: response regulator [Ignavibacteriota bacterium]